jgi:hypothetical protein
MKKVLIFFSLTIITLLNTCSDNPVKSENSSPIIFSLAVFPDVIGPSDSAIVICNAMDPDGDTLVYDWITDGRVRIKGANDYDHSLYHTPENSRIVYPKNLNNIPIDTLWIQCFARDIKGKSANRIVLFFLIRQDEGR